MGDQRKVTVLDNKLLLIERNKNVCTLVLKRPEKKNSLSPELVEKLSEKLEELATDDSIRALVVTGFGDHAFCSGYDIRSLPTQPGEDVREKLKTLNPVESLFKSIVNYPYPVIAMMNGLAFGAGCELSICCDIRIGADNIRMGMPPAKLGLVYPWTGLQRFIQAIGLKSTREIFFTGRTYGGIRLKEIGLVDYLVPREELEAFTYQMAEEIAANAPLALKGTKRVLNLLIESVHPDNSSMQEADSIAEAAFLSEDIREGQMAFLEKRKPQFRGR